MNVKINPALWNSLTRLQKHVAAENMIVAKAGPDFAEIAAWLSTLAVSAGVVAFAAILLR
jgi:hypothetical protein